MPWRAGCPYRDAAREFVTAHYSTNHPWPIVLGEMGTDEEWCKGEAVRRGIERTDADVLVIADADVVTDPAALSECVTAVQDGLPWAVPHHLLKRLQDAPTAALLAGEDIGPRPLCIRRYEGHEGGGILVIRRDVYLDVGGFDRRFVGWGGEDDSLRDALYMLKGHPLRLRADMLHLYHPGGDGKHKESPANLQLRKRYRDAFASKDPRRMRALIQEAA